MTTRKPTENNRNRRGESAQAEHHPATANREALIERRKLAGAGRREEPGTAFGSRWTQAERDELQTLLCEHGREQGIARFIAKYPHRTANGAAYQIDKHLVKKAAQ